MSNFKKADEIAFNRKYSRFKLHMFFTRRMNITHYGQERYHCTVMQIRFGYVKQVILDREKGLQDCIDRIAILEKLYGQYQTALIFDRRRDTRLTNGQLEIGKEIRKYIMGQLVEFEDFVLPDNEKKIVTAVIHKNNQWTLKPLADPLAENIDFKTQVTNAINTPKK